MFVSPKWFVLLPNIITSNFAKENNNSSVKLPFIQSKIECIGYKPVATILLLIALGILFGKNRLEIGIEK